MGLDPRPYTLRRLYQMAAGRWEFEVQTVATGIAAAFAGNDSPPPKNPFDRRPERKLTPEEIAEEERAIAAKAEVEARVHARRLARKRERANGVE